MGIDREIHKLNVNSAKVNLGRGRKLAFHVRSSDTMFARFYIGLTAGCKPRARAGSRDERHVSHWKGKEFSLRGLKVVHGRRASPSILPLF